MHSQKLEELLETVFTQREQGHAEAATVLQAANPGHAPGATLADFGELAALGFLTFDGKLVELTPAGEDRAREVVRRHRLAERLFRDLLELNDEQAEGQACEFEHVLSAEATESVCTLLGHPPTCPHGKAIPPGRCCAAASSTVRPLVTALNHLALGTYARIVFLAPRFHERADRLAGLGILPGCVVKLRQRFPAYVVEAGETIFALDDELAADVFVKPLPARAS